MKKPTQKEQILEILNNGDTLTVKDALARIGCYALSQRVGELIKEGHPIKSRPYKVNKHTTVSEYYIERNKG